MVGVSVLVGDESGVGVELGLGVGLGVDVGEIGVFVMVGVVVAGMIFPVFGSSAGSGFGVPLAAIDSM